MPSLRSMAAFAENLYMARRTFSKAAEKAKPFVNKNSTFSKQDQPKTEFARVEHNPSFQACGSMTFLSKPCSLALSPNSKFWVQEAEYKGISHFFLKLLLYYSKESRSIRNANILYKRILYQVDRSEIYDTFSLEKCFRTAFALLMLHVWLCLSRLKLEGKDGIELGQYLYEHYNRDLELRVASAGVNLLLTTWMKDLEKIFYGNCAAYDAAIRPEAGKDELALVIWRNIFSDEDSPMPKGSDAAAVQALARYTRRECACLALT
ncbi:hypothetical protein SUGI_0515980, partial [Cryptomeria japonica]